MQRSDSPRVRFDEFEFDLEREELFRGAWPLDLRTQPARLLGLLIRNAGRLVTREEIQQSLWDSDTHVDFDQGINQCVRQVRATLDDTAEAPRFIETVPRRGYRFVGSIEAIAPVDEPDDGPPDRIDSWRGPMLALLVGGIALASVVGGALQSGLRRGQELPAHPVVVVLPFQNLGPDDSGEFFVDALTEELIGQLGRRYSGRMGVIARTSAMHYKNTTKDVDTIRSELNADFLVEGSVRRQGDDLRITAQLIRTEDASHLWAANFDRTISDLLGVQKEVSDKIALALGLELLPGAVTLAAATNPRAYEAYLEGKAWSHDYDRGDPTRHIRSFERAVELDPGFAPAWAALGQAYWGRPELPAKSVPDALRAVGTALALDDGLPQAHLTLAMIRFYYEWDLEGARRSFQRAVDLNPGFAEAWHAYAAYFSVTGDHDRALEAVERARALDPLSPSVTSDIGWYSYFAGRHREAIDRCRETLDRSPGFYYGHYCIVFAALQLDDYRTALDQMRSQMQLRDVTDEVLARLDAVEDPREAIEVYWAWDLQRLESWREHVYLSPSWDAEIHLARGDPARALPLLERAVEERSGWILPFLRVDPLADPLRDNERFQAVLDTIDRRGVLHASR